MAITDAPFTLEPYETSLQQSWSFPAAREALARRTSTFLVTDMMSAGLDYKERLRLFLDVLAATLDVVECDAIHWNRSQQLAEPAAMRNALSKGFSNAFCLGPLNVRLFNIEGMQEHSEKHGAGVASFLSCRISHRSSHGTINGR